MPTAGSCEHGYESLCFIKMGNFIISSGTSQDDLCSTGLYLFIFLKRKWDNNIKINLR
jgi:hypothetical protein